MELKGAAAPGLFAGVSPTKKTVAGRYTLLCLFFTAVLVVPFVCQLKRATTFSRLTPCHLIQPVYRSRTLEYCSACLWTTLMLRY